MTWAAGKGGASGGGGGVTDHGGLTGLADDDHTQYLLVAGTRAMAGDLDMGANAITNVGDVDGRDVSADGGKLDGIEAGADVTDTTNVAAAGAFMTTGGTVSGITTFSSAVTFNSSVSTNSDHFQTNASPAEFRWNQTEENTDGGRESREWYLGEKLDGTLHFLGSDEVSHDGTGNDTNGKRVFRLNDGTTTYPATPVLFATWYGATGLAEFVGEVRHPAAAHFQAIKSADQSMTFVPASGLVMTTVSFTGTTIVDAGFSWGANAVTADRDGRIEVGFDITIQRSSAGTRGAGEFELRVDTGGGYARVPGSRRTAYFRSTTVGSSCSCRMLVDVSAGDDFRVYGGNAGDGTASTIDVKGDSCVFWARYVQEAI